MTTHKAATGKAEAEFEAEIRSAIQRVLPWVPAERIRHQTLFNFKFGRADVTVDGRQRSEVTARSDILIYVVDEPVAVLELKRPGMGVFDADVEQGLSYARMLHPRPPLVIVTDGADTKIIETHSAKEWEPISRSEAGLKTLFSRVASVAAGDLKRAVSHLMGGDVNVWGQAIRAVTSATFETMTKGWDSPAAPFVRDFLFCRKAVAKAIVELDAGTRLVLIQGPPLSGKTNALREMAKNMDEAGGVFLYLDADRGLDLFDRLAGLLSEFLDWPITSDEAKHWLATISKSDGPPLILAIDNLGADQDQIYRAVEEVVSGRYRDGVRIVLAVDDGVARKMMVKRDGRGPSELASKAVLFGLGPLDDDEFAAAERVLEKHRFAFMAGGRFCPEYREPWILRTMCAKRARYPGYHQEPTRGTLFPPLADEKIFLHVTRTLDRTAAPFTRYRELARAMLADVADTNRSTELVYEQASSFVIRRDSAKKYLDSAELSLLEGQGLLRETKSLSGENVYAVRLPLLLAYEIAILLIDDLNERAAESSDAELKEFILRVERLPLADLIGVWVVLGTAKHQRIMKMLLQTPPKQKRIPAGARVTQYIPGRGMVNMTIQENGGVLYECNGDSELVPPEHIGPGAHLFYEDLCPWLILSHLSKHLYGSLGGNEERLDEIILLGVGSSPMPLRRFNDNIDVPLHELPGNISIACHVAGVVEPVVWSIFCFLDQEGPVAAERFIAKVIEIKNIPLLARTHAAMHNFRYLDAKANWARGVLKEKILPAVPKHLAWAFMHPWRIEPIPPIVPSTIANTLTSQGN